MRHDELKNMCQQVIRELGEGPPADRVACQREKVLEKWGVQETLGRIRFFALAGAGGVALGVLAFLAFWLFAGRKDGFDIAETGAGRTKNIHAHENPVVVELSQGNTVRMEPFSTGKVRISTQETVEMDLYRGTLHSRVKVPMNWVVRAGPWRVSAEGTVFAVSWHDTKLEVVVTSGRVRVMGVVANQNWAVRAGEKLTVEGQLMARHDLSNGISWPLGEPDVDQNFEEPERKAVHPADIESVDDVPSTQDNEDKSGNPMSAVSTPPPVMKEKPQGGLSQKDHDGQSMGESAVPEWKQALLREEFARAVHLVEQGGLVRFADTANLPDLQSVANAARFAGRGTQAKTLLLALRSRFPQTGQAAVASFLLGRVYTELLQDPGGAVDWFAIYLKEAPKGPLAEEALGRKMDVAHRGGRPGDARSSARELIRKYPESPFIPQARRILGIEEPAWAQ